MDIFSCVQYKNSFPEKSTLIQTNTVVVEYKRFHTEFAYVKNLVSFKKNYLFINIHFYTVRLCLVDYNS